MSAEQTPTPETQVDRAYKRGYGQGYQDASSEIKARSHSADLAAWQQGDFARNVQHRAFMKALLLRTKWTTRGCRCCGAGIIEVPLPNGKVDIVDWSLRPHRDTCDEMPSVAS